MSRLRRPKNELFTTGIYKSRDLIANFKIKVKLEKDVVQKCNNYESGQAGLELRPILPENGPEIEEKIFSWQEKVFSLREIKKYSNPSNCNSTLDDKYHKDVTKITKKRLPRNKLFTYTTADKFAILNEFSDDILIPANKNYLTDKIKDLHCKRTKITGDTIAMTIMADVGESEASGSTSDEVVLCVITYSAGGALSVTPDFNDSREPYQFEMENGKKTIFRYTLQHVSPAITKEENENETKIYQEMHLHRVEMTKNAIGDEFEMPRPNFLKVFLFCEIVSARDFGWKNLYVNYIVDLPAHWSKANGEQQLSGSTLTAATSVCGRDDVAHFSYPFSIELNLDTQQSKFECLRLPQLLLQVWSSDYWNRYTVEGYGHTNIPSQPGSHKCKVPTFQPTSSSTLGRLRHFFLGTHPEFDDLAFPAAGSQKCHPLNRVGIRTNSSGSVDVRMQIIHQSLDFMEPDAMGGSLRKLVSGFGSLSIQSSVLTVLEAFQRARRRMLKARESLLSTSSSLPESCEGPLVSSTRSESCEGPLISRTRSGSSESSSCELQTVQAIVHRSEDVTTLYGETLDCDSDESFRPAPVNRARMRRREQKLGKLPSQSSS